VYIFALLAYIGTLCTILCVIQYTTLFSTWYTSTGFKLPLPFFLASSQKNFGPAFASVKSPHSIVFGSDSSNPRLELVTTPLETLGDDYVRAPETSFIGGITLPHALLLLANHSGCRSNP
jgi:hypothetical protein